MNFGAFVELEPGVEGLIPISEMSWSQHVRNPKDILNVGDNVDLSAVAGCGEPQVEPEPEGPVERPWTGVTERYPPGTTVSGLVTRITNFGAFVQLEDGIEGLVHISQISAQRIRAVSDAVEVGKVVQVRVLSVDADQRRVSLSMKPLPAPEPERAESAAAGDEATAAPPRPEKKRKRPLRGGLAW